MKASDYLLLGAKWTVATIMAQWVAIPTAITAMWIFMGLDFVTGVLASIASGRALSSQIGFRGFARKALITMLVLLSHLMEKALGVELGAEKAVAIAYTANEAISIIENCARGGIPILIPDSAMSVLRRLTQDKPNLLLPEPPANQSQTQPK